MNFDEAWGRASIAKSAVTRNEGYQLYSLADQIKGGRIVEIGSYSGRSSIILGSVANKNGTRLCCVDTFQETPKEKFIENMRLAGVVYGLLAMTSEKASYIYKHKIDLLFVDGDHRYEGVKKDCELWLPKLKPGGYVCFHDYKTSWDGVKRAVDEYAQNLIDEGIVDSMKVLRNG